MNCIIVSSPSVVTVGEPVVVPEYSDVFNLNITIPEPPEPPSPLAPVVVLLEPPPPPPPVFAVPVISAGVLAAVSPDI